MSFFALGDSKSLLLGFSWSFYEVKTQRSKNGMEAIF
jgi:hypothetical protein